MNPLYFYGAPHSYSIKRGGDVQVYWYTVEFGVVMEGDQAKAFGAGILSRFGAACCNFICIHRPVLMYI